MLSAFVGEFLIHPIPLELSLNYCSHKCGYCFANLNQPNRRYNKEWTERLLSNRDNRHNLPARLLRAGYPVVLSNKVDPFAATNWRESLPLLETLTQQGTAVAVQTRGGQGVAQALDLLPPSVWYLSIPFLSEDLRRQLEPGAPTIESRLELVGRLIRLGHEVVIGVNPFVPEWQADPAPLMAEIKRAGAWGVWVERLHLNRAQVANMSGRERLAIGEAVIKRACQYKTHPLDLHHFHLARATAVANGLHIFSHGQPQPTNFFQPYERLYPRLFPTLQGFVNHLWDTGGEVASFPDFWGYMRPFLPEGEWPLGYYLGATSRQIYRDTAVTHTMTFEQLLAVAWGDCRVKFSPLAQAGFALIKQDGEQLVDPHGRPYLAWSGRGFSDYWLEV